MVSTVQSFLQFGKQVMQAFTEQRSTLAAGGLAYFIVLSLVPTLLAFGAIAGLLIDPGSIDTFIRELAKRAPESTDPDGAVAQGLVQVAESASSSALTVSSIIALALALYAASNVVLGMRMALDAAFDVPISDAGPLRRVFAALIALGGLIIAAVIAALLTFLPSVFRAFDLPLGILGAWFITWPVTFLILVALVRLLYTYGPHARLRYRIGWGAPGIWIAGGWLIAATAFVGVYVSVSSTVSAAAAIFGGAIVLLLWLYLLMLGLLFGAQIEAERQRSLRSETTAGDPQSLQ
jgi:membrane protein